MRLKSTLVLAFLFLIHGLVFSQTKGIDFQHLSVRNGLSSSTIYCIHQDSKGFIWIGTDNGLDCYDGYEFISFNHDYQDPFSISGDRITSIAEDDVGNLWIGVWDGGLNYYDRSTGKFHAYTFIDTVPNTISGNAVWSVIVDSYKQIWIGTINFGLSTFDPVSGEFTRYNYSADNPGSISSDFITAIFEDSYGSIWVGTENEGLNLFDRNTHTFRHFKQKDSSSNALICNEVNTLYEDAHHNLWIGTKGGVSVLSSDRESFTNYFMGEGMDFPNVDYIVTFCEDEDSNVWIGTSGGGILIYDPVMQTFSSLRHDPVDPKSITTDVLSVIFKSRDDIIWAGTFRGGLNIYDKKKYKFLSQEEDPLKKCSLQDMPVMSVFEDAEENIWIGTDGFGLIRHNTRTGTCSTFTADPSIKGSISGNVVKKIYEDSQGYLWLGIWNNGLNLLLKDEEKFIHFKHDPSDPYSISNNDVWDIVEDADGNLWIATLSGGLNLFDRKSRTFSHFRQSELSDLNQHVCDNIFSIIKDKERGGLWIATIEGLSYYNPEKKQYFNFRYEKDNRLSISSNEIRTLFQDSENNIWIGTKNGGLNLYHPETNSFSSYGTNEGLSSNLIAGIIEDDEHNLWVSTNKGISRFNPVKGEFSNYTTDDGLTGIGFMEGAVCKGRNGALFFGYEGGLDVVHPTDIATNEAIPPVYITRLLLANTELGPGKPESLIHEVNSEQKEIRLMYSQSAITLEFTALNFTNTEKNQYAYRFEGIDQKWSYLGSNRTVTFSRLDPGSYTLKVKASNNDGVWNEEGTSLIINILPPWWKTKWFKVFSILLLTGFFLSWYIRKLNMSRRQQRLLSSLVNKRTHELAREKEIVEKQRDEIKEMSEKIHLADEEKLNFFTNISHEIRTPLTLILSPLDNLISSYKHDRILQSKLIRIYRNALGMNRLVNQILDFRKIDNKDLLLKASKHNVAAALRESMAPFYDIAAQCKITFSFTPDSEEMEAWLDREKFNRIIYNLLSNAFKFTEEGGSVIVHVSIEKKPEHILPAEYIIISITDTGKGIPSNQLDKIFDKFYQAGPSINTHFKGTGLGLSIAKSLAELHHGMLTVESKEGEGSCFAFWLPAGKEHLKDTEIVLNHSEGSYDIDEFYYDESHFSAIPDETSKGKDIVPEKTKKNLLKILIVEDNSDLRQYLKENLSQDFLVQEASNGTDALKRVRKISPDLIISDVMMPEMDGLELCRKIKSDIRFSHIPLIILTAKASMEFKIEGLGTGADDYIAKPFDYRELKARIVNILNGRELLKKKFRNELVLKPGDIVLNPMDEDFIIKAVDIVEKYMSDPYFSISVFLSEMAVSRTLLHVKLKELTGQSASEFIRSLRMKRAAQLLVRKGMPISEISYMVGIDPKYFSKCFKKQFGMTPGKYIEEFSHIDIHK